MEGDTSNYWYLELNFYLFIDLIKDINEMNTKCPDICVKVMDNNTLISITVNRYILCDYMMFKILKRYLWSKWRISAAL